MPEYDIMSATIRGCGFDSITGQSWIVFGWEARGVGSGEITLSYNAVENSWGAETETMSRPFVKAVLAKIADCYVED